MKGHMHVPVEGTEEEARQLLAALREAAESRGLKTSKRLVNNRGGGTWWLRMEFDDEPESERPVMTDEDVKRMLERYGR